MCNFFFLFNFFLILIVTRKKKLRTIKENILIFSLSVSFFFCLLKRKKEIHQFFLKLKSSNINKNVEPSSHSHHRSRRQFYLH